MTSPKPAFPTRLPPKVKRQVSKTSVAYETSSKSGARPIQNALSPAFPALDTHDVRRGLRRTGPKRTLACVSRPRHARSPRVAPDRAKTHTHDLRRGLPRTGQIALLPAFRALDTRDPRRELSRTGTNRTLACILRTRSPQRVAHDRDKSHSRLHFAHSTRTIPAEGCPGTGTNRTLACISRPRHARSAQRVAPDRHKFVSLDGEQRTSCFPVPSTSDLSTW